MGGEPEGQKFAPFVFLSRPKGSTGDYNLLLIVQRGGDLAMAAGGFPGERFADRLGITILPRDLVLPGNSILYFPDENVTCSISVTSFKPKPDERLPAELVINNNGPTAIRICTLCMGWRHTWKGGFYVNLTPDSWKTNTPTLEMSAQSIVTIQPGGIARIPFEIFTDKNQQIHVTASYSVERKFAEALHVWSGYIEAKPVDIQLEQ